VIAFYENFGESLGLETFEDEIVIFVSKPATAGMENRKPIVMQGHLDMASKNGDTTFDFYPGIDMYVDADWVRAQVRRLCG
jgi:dipeptidase D